MLTLREAFVNSDLRLVDASVSYVGIICVACYSISQSNMGKSILMFLCKIFQEVGVVSHPYRGNMFKNR
jgi:hypothetical protein